MCKGQELHSLQHSLNSLYILDAYNASANHSQAYCSHPIDHFTIVCSVTWPLNGSEAGGDFALIQTCLLLSCKYTKLALEQLDLDNKSGEVCIKTRSPPASLPFKCQVPEQNCKTVCSCEK